MLVIVLKQVLYLVGWKCIEVHATKISVIHLSWQKLQAYSRKVLKSDGGWNFAELP